MITPEVVLALADAPARTGSLIKEALQQFGQGWSWFEHWVIQPGHLQCVLDIATDVIAENWGKAVADLAQCFKNNP